MIVLGERRDDLNVVHLVYGPETEFQLDMNGHIVLNISEYCKQHKNETLLVINRCRNEEDVANMLSKLENHKKLNKTENEDIDIPVNTEKTSSSYKCPICLQEGKGVLKNGLVKSCKTCQLIDDRLKEYHLEDQKDNKEIRDTLNNLVTKDPKKFQILLQKLYFEQKRKEKINEQ